MLDIAWFWASIGLIVLNVSTAAALAWVLFGRHRHTWDDWSQWIEDREKWSNWADIRAVRYRVCDECSDVQRQIAGSHRCIRDGPCRHLENLTGSASRIKRLERDLGLDT